MKVVVAGGGFAGVEAVLALHEFAGDRIDIELVSASDTLTYRPHAVREPFGLGSTERIPLRPLCHAHGVTFRIGRVMSVNVPGHRVETEAFGPLEYDLLLLATGARRQPAVTPAITFDGTRGVVELQRLLSRAVRGEVDRIAFVVPDGVAWPLPLYELALLTYAYLREHGASVALDIVTPEPEPLALFGPPASDRIRSALTARGIRLHPVHHLRRLAADAVVALPRVAGPCLRGLPCTADGFIPVDGFGLVEETMTAYAAGDVTNFPVKQGGLATQQAEAAATHIAVRAGVDVKPRPFAPVLRGFLLTGAVPLHLRGGAHTEATSRPLWPARGKVIGTRLSRWLGLNDPGDRPQGLELALMLADDEAQSGNPGAALEWLAAAEAIAGRLPPAYEVKRRTWTLGAHHVKRPAAR